MRARIGDLAIVRFDPDETDKSKGRKWDERVGLVTGCYDLSKPREYTFIYWVERGNRTKICIATLPSSRLVRARPARDDWKGTLHKLTRNNVIPVLKIREV